MPDNLFRDLKIGFRILIKERTFCALAVIVLALGISGVTTMFSVVDGVMLRGFSFPNARRLVSVNFIDPSTATAFNVNGQVSAMDYEELRPQQRSYDMLAAYLNGSTVNLTVDGQPQRLTGAYITPDFLKILGIAPVMGRDITEADNAPGAGKVAIIGYGVWQRQFGGAADIVGRGVRVNGKPATIVGVMAQGFAFPTNEEIWIPLYSEFPPKPRTDPSAISPSVVGLLKEGVSLDQANAEATTIARRFAADYPETNKQFNTGQVQPLHDVFAQGPIRGTLWTMLAFCVGVLLISCANVMNMQFARATLRAKELAVRSSLGASRMRLVRQMLTESLLVAGIGAVVGIALAYVSVDWLDATVHNLENPPPSWMTFDLSGRALLVTVVATLSAAVLSGLLPALMSSRANAVEVLRDGGRGNTSRAVGLLSRGLVVAQIVVTCVLLVGSLLQVRSLLKQQTIDYGYDTEGLISARMGLMDGDYPTPASRKIFYDRLLQEIATDPEFEAAALTNRFRMVFSGSAPIELDGHVYQENRDRPNANFEQVSGGYFDVMGQKLLEGRSFKDDDLDDRQPVAIVNAAFAQKHFGSESPLGRRFRTVPGGRQQPGPWRTIVGVVSTVRMMGPFNQPGVDDFGLLRAVLFEPGWSDHDGAVHQPVRDDRAEAARRPARRRDGDGAAARGAQHRSEPAALLHRHAEIAARRLRGAEPDHRDDVLDLRRRRDGARGGRDVRRDVVLGEPAAAGVRRPDGARCALRAHPADGGPAGDAATGAWPDSRYGSGTRCRTTHGVRHSNRTLRRQRHRSVDLRRRHGADRRRLARRHPGARTPGDTGRSDDRAARRVGGRT